MSIGNSIPKVGEHFKCKKLEKNANGEIRFSNTETTTVQEVKKAAGNVFIVATRNSYYVTRVLHMPAENIHFAIVKEEPKIGSGLHCYKLEFKGENCRCVSWQTTKVIKVNNVHGLYKVGTFIAPSFYLFISNFFASSICFNPKFIKYIITSQASTVIVI